MAVAIREMNDKGVVWTDHKLENFDIVPKVGAPTGYQMVIFDTGSIRPVTGATKETRAATAVEVQRAADSSPHPKDKLLTPLQRGNMLIATMYLDDRVFGIDVEMPIYSSADQINRADNYFELSTMTDEALEAYARTLLGPDADVLPGP